MYEEFFVSDDQDEVLADGPFVAVTPEMLMELADYPELPRTTWN